MIKKEKKTNAMRILDSQGIAYDTMSYRSDGEAVEGTVVAELIGMAAESVFKTLVTKCENQIIVCEIPVDKHLNLKTLAAAAGVKKLEMVAVKDIFKLTGYVRGGCSPLGMKKDYPAFIDESSLAMEKIAISAGVIGKQIVIDPVDLMKITKAKKGNFTM